MKCLRYVVPTDVELVYKWSNDSLVRSQSFSTKHIEWNEHLKWFEDVLKEENILFYILTVDNHDVGQIRFNLKDGKAIISYSIASKYRNNGYGELILMLGEKRLYELYGSKYVLEAEVKNSNTVSHKLFKKLNYRLHDSNEKYVTYRKTLE